MQGALFLIMQIVQVTNSFLPHVSGVAQSVQRFSDEYEKQGHSVSIIAPAVTTPIVEEYNVVRVPLVAKIKTLSWAVVPNQLNTQIIAAMRMIGIDIVHSHNPFLLGGTARKLSVELNKPLVFTYHTMYEHYTHVFGDDNQMTANMLVRMSTEYANNCDTVIAPSQSVKNILQNRGVISNIAVVPTGVDVDLFATGSREKYRKQLGIPKNDFVIGHVGRLTPEKNLGFLIDCVEYCLKNHNNIWFLVVGDGPLKPTPGNRCITTGVLSGKPLIDAFSAFDVFAFSSVSETQGMVLMEAMAAGVPCVALSAPGASDVIQDGITGRLVKTQKEFVKALGWVLQNNAVLKYNAQAYARRFFSMKTCADKALNLYESLLTKSPKIKAKAPLPQLALSTLFSVLEKK